MDRRSFWSASPEQSIMDTPRSPSPSPTSGGIRGLFGRAHTCSLSGSCRVISQKLVT